MRCGCGYHFTSTVTQEMTCPLCGQKSLVRNKDDQGRFAWKALHECGNPTPEWYEKVWLPLVPDYDCQCRDHWRRITSRKPPDFSSPEAFHRWAIDRHNDVNHQLRKPLWPIKGSE